MPENPLSRLLYVCDRNHVMRVAGAGVPEGPAKDTAVETLGSGEIRRNELRPDELAGMHRSRRIHERQKRSQN